MSEQKFKPIPEDLQAICCIPCLDGMQIGFVPYKLRGAAVQPVRHESFRRPGVAENPQGTMHADRLRTVPCQGVRRRRCTETHAPLDREENGGVDAGGANQRQGRPKNLESFRFGVEKR